MPNKFKDFALRCARVAFPDAPREAVPMPPEIEEFLRLYAKDIHNAAIDEVVIVVGRSGGDAGALAMLQRLKRS